VHVSPSTLREPLDGDRVAHGPFELVDVAHHGLKTEDGLGCAMGHAVFAVASAPRDQEYVLRDASDDGEAASQNAAQETRPARSNGGSEAGVLQAQVDDEVFGGEACQLVGQDGVDVAGFESGLCDSDFGRFEV